MERGWTREDEDRMHERLLADADDRFKAVSRAVVYESRLGSAGIGAAAIITAVGMVIVWLVNPWSFDPWARQAAVGGAIVVGLVGAAALLYLKDRLGKWVLEAQRVLVRDTQAEMERYRHALERLLGASGAPGAARRVPGGTPTGETRSKGGGNRG